MHGEQPTFFAGRRVSVYFRGGRLIKDTKTGLRFWRLKWALTLEPADAHACGGAILSTYEHIQARENSAEEIILSGARGEMILKAFALSEPDARQVIRLDRCFLDHFRMTYAEGETEFWIQVEHELTDALHKFVKDYAFQRFWVEFETAQRSLSETVLQEGQGLVSDLKRLADEYDASTTFTDPDGKQMLAFKPKGKVQ